MKTDEHYRRGSAPYQSTFFHIQKRSIVVETVGPEIKHNKRGCHEHEDKKTDEDKGRGSAPNQRR